MPRSVPRTIVLASVVALALAVAASVPGVSRPPVASAAVCSSLAQAPGNVTRTIVSGGITRTYQLHIPPSYDGVTPLPLVLNFHGLGSNQFEQIFVSDLYPRADAQGFLVASPLGRSTPNLTSNHWNITALPTSLGEADDVLFTSDIINDVAAQVCVDVARVYSTGMSNGAQMSTRLGCSLSSRIAAIAPVAGVYYPPLIENGGESCPDTRPMPVIAFHGTSDNTIPFDGGPGALGAVFRDIDDTIMPAWAARNGCASGPTTSLVAPGVNLIEYGACTDGASAQLYAIFDYDGAGAGTEGGGHIWPGSPYMPAGHTNAIEATDLMLAFFSQFTVPCAAGDADCDAVMDAADNCVSAYNPGQQNSDRNNIDLPGKSFDDLSRANSDLVGDACDTDDDNDGRLDADEVAGTGPGTCTGVTTNPLSRDSDGDNYGDAAECAAGTDPNLASSRPLDSQCGPNTDADGDGLLAFREVCFYDTDPLVANSDGDSCNDGREVASVNAANGVDVIDLQQVASEFGPYAPPGSPVKVNYDITRNLSIDVIDLQRVAALIGSCP